MPYPNDSIPIFHTALIDGPVDVLPFDWSQLPNCGAESIFLGRTRGETHPQFGPLLHLEYEAYEPMVRKMLDEMAREAAGQFHLGAVRLVHSRGVVPVGAASVVIQTAAPHRDEAFRGCRYLIERVKHELPMWKREVWERGTTFVEGSVIGAGSIQSINDKRPTTNDR